MKDIMAIVPSLNPDQALIDVVDSLLQNGIPNVIVIDDGSDEQHKQPFIHAKEAGCIVLTHEVNCGKGKALRTAFQYVKDNCPSISAVITVDGDNQHTIKDIKACVEKYREKPDSIVLGCRDFSGDDVPARSKFGNNMTRWVFRFACGLKVSDTQTGLRCIPAKYMEEMLEIRGDRYEYETNMLLRMKDLGIPCDEVKIHTIYIDDNSSSHFSPIKDSIRIYGVILKFLMSSIWSFVIDIALFTLICYLLKGHMEKDTYILIGTVGARVVSSLCNFIINHKIVFRGKQKMHQCILKYYALALVIMGASYLFVNVLAGSLGVDGLLLSLIKIVVDCILFLLSFRIQKMWVFK